MDKKKAIINTLMGKIQSRSSKLFEDVSNEIWNDVPMDAEKDYDLEVDGDEIKEDDDEEEVKALDVILDAPVDSTPKNIEEE